MRLFAFRKKAGPKIKNCNCAIIKWEKTARSRLSFAVTYSERAGLES